MNDYAELTFYIKSGAPYKNSTVGFTPDNYISLTRDGTSPAQAFYFMKQAISRIYQQSKRNIQINATIYLSKGEHFFYHCD